MTIINYYNNNVSYLNIANGLRTLYNQHNTERAENIVGTMRDDISNANFTNIRKDAYGNLRKYFLNFQKHVQRLSSEYFSKYSVSNLYNDNVDISINNIDNVEYKYVPYQLKIKQMAQEHILRSNRFTSGIPNNGNIIINGRTVSLSAGDTLPDISKAINEAFLRDVILSEPNIMKVSANAFAEPNEYTVNVLKTYPNISTGNPDYNWNAEIEFNGTTVYSPSNTGIHLGKGITITELYKPSNGEFTMTVTPGNREVWTWVNNGYLYIQGLDKGDGQEIDFNDDDGILQEIGVLNGNLEPNFYYDTTQNKYIYNELQKPQNAIIEVNGKEYTSKSNEFKDVKGFNIKVKKDSEFTIKFKIKKDIDTTFNTISEFTKNYNTLVENLNDKMMTGEPFQFDPVMYRVKDKLDKSVNDTNYKMPDYINNADKIGIDTNKKGIVKFQEYHFKKINKKLDNIWSSNVKEIDGMPTFENAMTQIGLYRNDNGKLSINEDKLKEHLTNNYDYVKNLFQDKDNGIFNRIGKVVDITLKENIGVLDFRINYLNNIIEKNNQDNFETKDTLEKYKNMLNENYTMLNEMKGILGYFQNI